MLLDSLRSAIGSLWANKLRSFLTVLGIVIGIYAVVTLLSAARGVQKQIAGFVEDFGPRTILIMPGEQAEEGAPSISGITAPSTIFVDDVTHLQDKSKLLDPDMEYAVFFGGLVNHNDKKLNGLPVGITPGAEDLFSVKIVGGRSINDNDLTNKNRVIVLSEKSAEQISVKVGDSVKIGASTFEVVGLFKIDQELNLTSTTGDMFLVPASVATEINKSEAVNRIVVKAKTVEDVDPAIAEVKSLLTAKHGTSDFSVFKPTDLLSTVNQITDVMAYLVVGIASISLLVGGIGISNIMLVTVTERTREIGIRKAVGATESAILLQFLIEAILLTLFGSLIGIGLARISTLLIARFSPLNPVMSWQTIMLAVGMGAFAGIVFGLFPAIRAARKNPVDALRFE
ncbi:MAG: ABC transporter permease [Candidatus Berkelbacteria bacterium]|nr:MAG: ABC transporter permease [Candidatus Berkelbacteria bacterium]QQG51936.1 MAG: ABC transporter permease [Candidatus Berkelbacteria bacterium]